MSVDWFLSRDGDLTLYEMYRRHYPSKRNKNPVIKQFVGPGSPIVLRTAKGDAMWVWRKFKDDCIDERTGKPQEGVNCAVFRNENQETYKSSDLVRQADSVADVAWPGERHYTYVNPKKVRSRKPGYCFIKAGWKRCGVTKNGLLIFERTTQQPTVNHEHE